MNLRRAREEKGWSQGEMARRMRDRGYRWHPATVYSVEQHERRIPLDEAFAISNILGIDFGIMVAHPTAVDDFSRLREHTRVLMTASAQAHQELVTLRACRAMLKQTVSRFLSRGFTPDPEADATTIERALASAQHLLDRSDPEDLVRAGQEPAVGIGRAVMSRATNSEAEHSSG